MGWSDTAKLQYYVRRYGEAEGRAKFEQKTGLDAATVDIPSDAPMDDSQAGTDAERKPRRTSTVRGKKPARGEVLAVTATAVSMADRGAAWVFPVWRDDALTHEEIGLLADALTDEIMSSERLLAQFIKMQKAGRHTKLAYAVAMIALPRLAKHGMIPGVNNADAAPNGATGPVESGGAYGASGNDGQWEVYTGGGFTQSAPVFRGPEVQSGQGDVPVGDDGEVTYGNGRPTGLPRGAYAAMGEASE